MTSDPPALYKTLAQLPFSLFVTTDPSDDLERALEAASHAPARDDEDPRVLHLFGSVRRPDRLRSTTWRSDDAVNALMSRGRLRGLPQSPRLMVTLGFDPADAAPYLVRRSLSGVDETTTERVTMLIVSPPPSLRSAQQLARAQDYYRQYARSERVMYYWGEPADFAKEMLASST